MHDDDDDARKEEEEIEGRNQAFEPWEKKTSHPYAGQNIQHVCSIKYVSSHM